MKLNVIGSGAASSEVQVDDATFGREFNESHLGGRRSCLCGASP